MSRARPLGAKLYLEGIEVPFIGTTITSSVGMASIAYVDVVPHHTINHIKPRTHVSIAVRDYHNIADNFPYVLAWEGEVFGYSFGKTSQSRSMSLSCIDFTSYWDNALTYYFNAQSSLGKGTGDILPVGLDYLSAKAAGQDIVTTVHSTASFFRTIMEEVLKQPGKDFIDAFVAVINKLTQINDFYKAAETRYKIANRITLKSSGQLEELLKQKESLDWFNGVIGKESGFETLRSTINDLMSILFHDQTTVPFPAFVGKENKRMGQFVFKPNLYMIAPPLCNVFYPDEYSSFNFTRNFFREPTRILYKPELPLPGPDGARVALPHAYAPENFNRYMFGKIKKEEYTRGTDDFAVPKDSNPGYFGDPITGVDGVPARREGQFLTNEERYKGIWFAMEQMVPASSEFRYALNDVQRGDFTKKVANYLLLKKRFQTRELQITSHLKLSVVPGFTALLLDPSDAKQSTIAYCSSVTHRIYATEGGYSNVTLTYARTVAEQQASTTSKDDPLIPPWFSKIIFGEIVNGSVSTEEVKEAFGGAVTGKSYKGGKNLSEFYKTLLGPKGYIAITDIAKPKDDDSLQSSGAGLTLAEGVAKLIAEYNSERAKPNPDMFGFISKRSDRAYIRIRDAMGFLGASTKTADLRSDFSFSEFNGGAFDANNAIVGGEQITARRQVIRSYRDVLKATQGFKG